MNAMKRFVNRSGVAIGWILVLPALAFVILLVVSLVMGILGGSPDPDDFWRGR